MDLIKIYIQEVIRRLPQKTRDDIALELQSTIEDMLPEDYSEEDVMEILRKLGDPAILAEQYRDRPFYLIGPGFYELYVKCLKLVMSFAVTISLIVFFVIQFANWSGEGAVLPFLTNLIGEMIVNLLNTAFHVFGWITFAFFIIERSGVSPTTLRTTGKKWKPEDLKMIPYIPRERAIPRAEAVASLIWTVVWAVSYFNADHFIGVYERNSHESLSLVTPVFNQDVLLSYGLVIVLLIALEIILALFKWFTRQWTMGLAFVNTVYNFFSITLAIVILSNRELVHPAFAEYMMELFNSTPAAFEQSINWVRGIAIAVFIVTGAYNMFDGFRKARKQEYQTVTTKMDGCLK